MVQFKLRTRLVVTCAHRIAPRDLIKMPSAQRHYHLFELFSNDQRRAVSVLNVPKT
jgi:hypothetical protein